MSRHRLNLTIKGDCLVRKIIFEDKRAVALEVESAGERLESIHGLLDDLSEEEADPLRQRLEKLERWHKLGGGVVKQALKFINF